MKGSYIFLPFRNKTVILIYSSWWAAKQSFSAEAQTSLCFHWSMKDFASFQGLPQPSFHSPQGSVGHRSETTGMAEGNGFVATVGLLMLNKPAHGIGLSQQKQPFLQAFGASPKRSPLFCLCCCCLPRATRWALSPCVMSMHLSVLLRALLCSPCSASSSSSREL